MLREGKSLSGNERNAAFLNTGKEGFRFADVSAVSGFDDSGDGRGLALSDWDGDGDLDAWIANRTGPSLRVLENQLGGRSVAFELVGKDGGCSRDAIGARVEVGVDGRKLIRTLRAGEAFRSQGSKRLHFGLGEDGKITDVAVRWPGGSREIFLGVAGEGVYELVQGEGSAVKVERSREWLPGEGSRKEETGSEMIFLEARPLFPAYDYEKLEGGQAPKNADLTLAFLWQPECPLCEKELRVFAEKKADFEKAGLRVLALTNANEPEQRDLVKEKIKSTGFPFEVGLITDSSIERIQAFNRHLFYQPYHLEVPCGFLIDQEGRLSGLYRGEIEWENVWSEIRRDEVRMRGSRYKPSMGLRPAVLIKDYLSAGILLEGERVLRKEMEHETIRPQADEIFRALGDAQLLRGNFEDAVRLLLEANKISPENVNVLNSLGAVALAQNDSDQAIDYWKEAAKDPGYAEPRINLGKLFLREGETGIGMEYLREFHRISPNDADGHRYLAIGYLRQVEYSKAIGHLEEQIRLLPSDGVAYLNLAKAHLKLRDKEEALQVLRKGMSRSDVKIQDYAKLKELLQKLGE